MTFQERVKGPFEDDVETVWYYLTDRFIPAIRAGDPQLMERFIPYLERSAVARLKGIGNEQLVNEPDRWKDFERWRTAWVEHIRPSQGFTYQPVYDAAVSLLVACDDLRHAIERNDNPELVAALGMRALCDLLRGGAEMEAHELRVKAMTRHAHVQSTLGVRHRDYAKAEKACVRLAKELWSNAPDLRIGQVAKKCQDKLGDPKVLAQLSSLRKPPTVQAIKGWLKEASERGEIQFPPGSTNRGRPPQASQRGRK